MEEKLARLKELIAQKESVDAELASLLGVSVPQRRAVKCSVCLEEGHNAKTCPKKEGASVSS